MFRCFGEYELLESRLAQEPYSSYYLATSGERDRLVEIRVANIQLAAGGADLERAEARLDELRRLSHPNFVRIAYSGVRDGSAFYVTDPVESLSLDEFARQHGGKLDPEYAFDLLLPVGDALAYLHAQGIVHGHVSPLSVRVDPASERAYLGTLDLYATLGMSRPVDGFRQTGGGTLATPEAAKVWPVDARTDVFLFAAVLHRILTGRPAPTQAEAAGREAETLLRFRRPSQLVPLPKEVDGALLAALSFRPGDRTASMGDLLAELRSAQPLIGEALSRNQNRSKAIQMDGLARRQAKDDERQERRRESRRDADRRSREIAANPLNGLGYWFLDLHPVIKLALFALVAGSSSLAPLLDTGDTPLMAEEYVSARLAVQNKQFDKEAIKQNLVQQAEDATTIKTSPENYEDRLRALRSFVKALNPRDAEQVLSPKVRAAMRIAYAEDRIKGCAMLDVQLRKAYEFLRAQQEAQDGPGK